MRVHAVAQVDERGLVSGDGRAGGIGGIHAG
jgi:hypothetical protein